LVPTGGMVSTEGTATPTLYPFIYEFTRDLVQN
jgi:hypothetical protein